MSLSDSFLIDPPPSMLPNNFGDLVASITTTATTATTATTTISNVVADDNTTVSQSAETIDDIKIIDMSKKSSYYETQDTKSLSQLSVKELREYCRQQGLKSTGNRNVLEARIRSHNTESKTLQEE